MSNVIMYTLRNCPTCDKARAALSERGVEYEERRVDDNE
ncbi:MAG: glutaredoxin family protein, partial [Chloroflexi bacterium]|nr:glutaredoxin family protein [Chloroflexota bacterium]